MDGPSSVSDHITTILLWLGNVAGTIHDEGPIVKGCLFAFSSSSNEEE
jgi:hypothetical protein